MKQSELLEQGVKQDDRFDLGNGYCLHLPRGPRRQGDLYHHGTLSKRVNLSDKAERRLLVVELLQKNINQTLLAAALNLSRQTLHNYRDSYQAFGLNGLLHGYSPAHSRSQELQGRFHVSQRRPGSKARELEALRRDQKVQTQGTAQDELAWDGEAATRYSLEAPPLEDVRHIDLPATEVMPEESPSDSQSAAEPTSTDAAPAQAQAIELPYADTHGWEACRYAGIFPVVLVLISQSQWMQRLVRLYGNGWRLFMVFALMAVRNIRSIEQLKHERQVEAGRVLGLGRLPALDTVWSWFHDVADKKRSAALLKEFFADQIRCGVVGARLWFTDGHLLPYTGQDKVHAAWSTQRRLPMPGQTNLVTCDDQGRVVYFDIQEGLGDLRAQILKLGQWARDQSLGIPPVHVFDREGSGLGFFSELVRSHTPFITWEKNADQGRLMALLAADFTHRVSINGTEYQLLEQTRPCRYQPDAHPDAGTVEPEHCFNLRRVVLWNLRTDHRAGVLCWDDELALSPEAVATGMLSRWGASENTFKHIKARHPYHYRPGFAVSPSTKQDIANPRIKTLAQQISTTQGQLSKCYKKLAKTKPCLNQDGSERNNSQHRRISESITEGEADLVRLKSDKAQLPERVDVAGLADYRSFKAIDNEGKNLFDFVTASIWNVRRQLLDWLIDSYAKDNDRVDLLYAIFNCHGWIRSDDRWVVVRMEPLQQPSRRSAQEHLCRKLTGLGARIPGGKWLRVEVGETPL
ncbi:helix-turn-helix domain-containing protein [Propionivibrio sp.]|uniref:helix-turn-helix domain-containing protein n=1 Tax=Propionivibrio sp. TaxID=2212460 RepID=UPI003BF0146C